MRGARRNAWSVGTRPRATCSSKRPIGKRLTWTAGCLAHKYSQKSACVQTGRPPIATGSRRPGEGRRCPWLPRLVCGRGASRGRRSSRCYARYYKAAHLGTSGCRRSTARPQRVCGTAARRRRWSRSPGRSRGSEVRRQLVQWRVRGASVHRRGRPRGRSGAADGQASSGWSPTTTEHLRNADATRSSRASAAAPGARAVGVASGVAARAVGAFVVRAATSAAARFAKAAEAALAASIMKYRRNTANCPFCARRRRFRKLGGRGKPNSPGGR